MLNKTAFRLLFVSLLLAAGIILMGRTTSALADAPSIQITASASPTPAAPPTATPTPPSPHDDSNANCMMCHGNPNFHGIFENNESVSLYVSEDELRASVHADAGLQCVACHTNVASYPHTEKVQLNCTECHSGDGGGMGTQYKALIVKLPYPDKRAMTLDINDKCRTCHEEEYASTDGSAHEKVFESGNVNAPMCVDCHGGHNTIKPGTPRTTIVAICGKCHTTVETSFNVSVHGETLLHDPANQDVPTCINCHGVHSVRGPRETTFRGDSIVTCGGCHADKPLMKKYGISTEVFDTYLNDFHGRTVSLFQEAGKTSSNKATCYDCHGIHNIRRPQDSLSSVYPANLQHTCQQCHDEASIRFPEAWLSHSEISWEKTPLLFGLKAAYVWVLIPGTMGAFIIYIALDARRRWMEKRNVVLQALAEEDDDEYEF
ncbi:MAG: cytochrome c3 family protein [Anaerolineales bacterium]|nr:cytochrome c3 family protein [Anaerolineales bacterium]